MSLHNRTVLLSLGIVFTFFFGNAVTWLDPPVQKLHKTLFYLQVTELAS